MTTHNPSLTGLWIGLTGVNEMKLYEINEQMQQLLENGFDAECIDMETGEILRKIASEKLDKLMLDEQAKIENTALFIKNLYRSRSHQNRDR